MSKKYMSWQEAESNAPLFQMENLPIMHRQYQFKHFEGNLLTLIESMGLPSTQEEAIKSYARRELWDFVRLGYIVSQEADEEISQATLEINNPSVVMKFGKKGQKNEVSREVK